MARSSLAQLIAKVRLLIGDPASANQQFSDDQIQDTLDESREDIRYESLAIAPSIVNTASAGNGPQTIFADFYSAYQWWENDYTLQGNAANGAAWNVLTPLASEPIVGHWQFELNVYTTGTVPGQMPPVFATGKVFDPYQAAADLLDMWASTLAMSYDITVDGQSLRRSQMLSLKLDMAAQMRMKAKPRQGKMHRKDILPGIDTVRVRLLDSPDSIKGW